MSSPPARKALTMCLSGEVIKMLKKNKEKEIRKAKRLFIGRPARFEKKTAYNRKKLPKPLDTDR